MPAKKQWKVPVIAEDHVRYDYYDPSTKAWIKNGPPKIMVHKGTVCHYATQGSSTSFDYWGAKVEWLPPDYTVTDVFTLDEGLHSGRSAKWVTWTDTQHRNFPMFVAELVKVVRSGVAQPGGIVTGTFGVVKRGQNYGVEYRGA